MKRIIFWCFAVLGALSLGQCTPDEITDLDGAGIPLAADLDVEISVDQETNYVTFRLNNEGMTPVWIFSSSEMITQNPYQRRYRRAGEYSVEVKASNRNGISDGSLTFSFTLDNDYSASHPLYGETSKAWVIDAATAGHFGCGETIDNPAGWYAAGPNEKAGTGLYENVLTFYADGTYKFEAGDGGQIFVNTGVTLIGADLNRTPGTDPDFSLPWSDYTSTYEYNSSEGKLIFPQQQPNYTVLGYVPHDEYLSGSQLEMVVKSLSDEMMELVWYTPTGNGGGPIAWYMRYVPRDGVVIPEKDPLYGTGTKTWRIASHEAGHLGCGETLANPAGWYSAGPEEKKDFGMYDDRITFTEDGVYIYDPGADGKTFVNVGTSFNVDGYTEDFDMPNERQETTYNIDDDHTKLTFPAKTFLPYVPNDASFNTPEYVVLELTSDRMVLACYDGSIAWQLIFCPEDYGEEPAEPAFNPGAALEQSEYKDYLAGSWTWESSSFGHFGCGETIGNPVNWWPGGADCKAGCSMYDDVMTFGSDGSYTFDPTDGMTYMNNGVTAYSGTVVDSPLGDDFRVEATKQTTTFTFAASGDSGFPSFTLPAGTLFSYIANDAQLTTDLTYYITAMWENQMEISWYTATGNGGGPIAWRYRLKRVN